MLGYVNMDVEVTKDGHLHGYSVRRIEVSLDSLHWVVFSTHFRSDAGDSLIRTFGPWLDHFYSRMRAVNTRMDSLFTQYDTLWYKYVIRFKRGGR